MLILLYNRANSFVDAMFAAIFCHAGDNYASDFEEAISMTMKKAAWRRLKVVDKVVVRGLRVEKVYGTELRDINGLLQLKHLVFESSEWMLRMVSKAKTRKNPIYSPFVLP